MVIMCSLLWFVSLRIISKYKRPGDLHSEGLIIRGIFAFQIWGASIRRGLFSEFYGMVRRQESKPGLLYSRHT